MRTHLYILIWMKQHFSFLKNWYGIIKKLHILNEVRTAWLTIKHTDSLMWISVWREVEERGKRAKKGT